MKLLPYGPEAWLVELPESDVVGYAAAIEHRRHPAVVDIVPAAQTVLVRLAPGTATADVGEWLAGLTPDPPASGEDADMVEVAVTYDGDDLEHVAATSGLTVDDIVARHSEPRYVCAFCGFAPGFAYLRGLDPALRIARRATPRTRVPAGSVAIADTWTAVYPSASPGGWHLIGRTDVRMWDPDRRDPALVAPGTVVRFVAA